MSTYLVSRLLHLIVVLVGVTIIAFFFVHLIPGDPAYVILGERATPERVVAVREMLGLDKPLPSQYLRYVGRLLQGDLGKSIHTNNPVLVEFKSRFPATLELTAAAMLLALLVGVPGGVLAAMRRNSVFDVACSFGTLAGISMPVFWLGMLLIWVCAVKLGWLPPGGRLDPALQLKALTHFYIIDTILTGNWAALASAIKHLVLPALALSTIPMAIIARMTRSCMLETLGEDYVRTARAKGLPERVVIGRHVLKNAALPVVTVVGLQIGMLLSGAVLTESIFAWPGIGRWVFDAIQWRDYPVIQSMILVIAAIFVLVNLLVDLLYGFLDPRIRL